jgi:hypothetical protein
VEQKLTLTTLSEEELGAILERTFRKVLSETPLIQSDNPENEFLREAEARQFIGGLSKPTFKQLRESGKIPTIYSSDKRIVFRKSDLINYLQNAIKQ